jgi:hypothetical protein
VKVLAADIENASLRFVKKEDLYKPGSIKGRP